MTGNLLSTLVPGDRDWLLPAAVLAIAGGLLVIWLNRQRLSRDAIGPVLRLIGWLILCACLLNPLWSSLRPRSGANVVAVLVDNSRSHLIRTGSGDKTRADYILDALKSGEQKESPGWLTRLGQDFELRRFTVSDRLQQVDSFEPAEFNGKASSLHSAMSRIRSRFEGQPLAAILLVTDGNATDAAESGEDLSGLPPVFPIVPPDDHQLPDLAVGTIAVTQTAFDDAPLTIQVQPQLTGLDSGRLTATLRNAAGDPLETVTRDVADPSPIRFRHRPEESGTVFYRLEAGLNAEAAATGVSEATPVNNEQLIAVDRGSVPRRVLYVSGRPNWEFKFLRRAVESDPQLQIVGLVRIARKETKFVFRGREGETSNSLFRGFEGADKELTEEYDEPVLLRLNTRDDKELRGGFPESADELFQYDAIILDDLESDFFLADQHKLVHDFVTRRGGGFLMMGGQESFRPGGYDRTPIGELLPIDLSRDLPTPGTPVRLALSREGWLQPWVRLRSDEIAEEERLKSMPDFVTLNTTGFIRPGAVEMARVEDAGGQQWPALVVQRFGRGRTAALCIGDLWRWRLNAGLRELHELNTPVPDGPSEPAAGEETPTEDLSDHARASRQLIRWLVADVPQRLNVSIKDDPESGIGGVRLSANVLTSAFEPAENANVRFTVTAPDGREFQLSGEPSDSEPGRFEAAIIADQAGPWRTSVTADSVDESQAEPLISATGWAFQPDQQELRSVSVNRTWLEQLASTTRGKVVALEDVDQFADDLPNGQAPLVELWSWPVWNSWWVLSLAIGCIATDWTLRRRQGLP